MGELESLALGKENLRDNSGSPIYGLSRCMVLFHWWSAPQTTIHRQKREEQPTKGIGLSRYFFTELASLFREWARTHTETRSLPRDNEEQGEGWLRGQVSSFSLVVEEEKFPIESFPNWAAPVGRRPCGKVTVVCGTGGWFSSDKNRFYRMG